MDLSFEGIIDSLTSNNIPEIMILIGGIVALLVVITHLKNKEGVTYKFMVLIGTVVGIILILIGIGMYDKWDQYTTIIVIVAGFTLMIRPFRDLDFAILLALLVMAVAYVILGNLTGDLEVLSEGWARIGVTVAAGVISYMALHFLQSLVKLFGKLLNWWPILLILGIICIVEAIALYQGYASVYDLMTGVFT